MPTRGAVEALRAVKDADEIAAIGRAAAISDAVYEELSQDHLAGRTEVEVAWWIERAFRERGAQALSFEPIVASGENGSRPHAGAGDTVIAAGTLVTIDMGCVVDGYCSDCTRTFATGDLPAQLDRGLPPRRGGAARRAGGRAGGRARP